MGSRKNKVDEAVLVMDVIILGDVVQMLSVDWRGEERRGEERRGESPHL